jgi:hypothetical protein
MRLHLTAARAFRWAVWENMYIVFALHLPSRRQAGEARRSAPDRNSNMREYEIVDTNAGNISACSFCGYKAGRNEGHHRKSKWLKERYAEGLRFKVLRSREFGDFGMIEYALGNHAWRPVEAEGYLVMSAKASRELPTPYGMFSIFYDGRLIVERPVSGTRFKNIMSRAAATAQ